MIEAMRESRRLRETEGVEGCVMRRMTAHQSSIMSEVWGGRMCAYAYPCGSVSVMKLLASDARPTSWGEYEP